ncbi:MAG: 30S ribosomal protein S17 [Nitrososphaerota archaeon]|nr:30S ribosomal protein S17 [Nitrososphaerota archaeon]MDG6955811.1 30S ribosomal protein S17 [Nitrososphaerota archaeon]MDG6957593.1 30S ribosomal protein S17 [Nitrososphaerota archaeon]MDG6959117.1 30S ribosomal protein S17 [Nitrososphaerota archaeon]MDG6965211.1 30S ribosomal protein S17 [Nitrososphaerota archaeon]
MSAAGLEVAAPKKKCQDDRCPFHGHVKVRGRLLSGKAVSTAGKSFAVVEMEYLHMVPKYNRGERRRSRVSAHVPPCIEVRDGDAVTLGECRPLSKTIAFVVVESRRRA